MLGMATQTHSQANMKHVRTPRATHARMQTCTNAQTHTQTHKCAHACQVEKTNRLWFVDKRHPDWEQMCAIHACAHICISAHPYACTHKQLWIQPNRSTLE